MDKKENVSKMSKKSGKLDRLSGNKLIKYIANRIKKQNLKKLKVTWVGNEHIHIYFIRSIPLENILREISNRARMAALTTQHIFVQVFLNHLLYNGQGKYEVIVGSKRIDLEVDNLRHEIKTKSDVDGRNLGDFIDEYFDTMIDNKRIKHIWFYVFLLRRADAKINKAIRCIYYLVVVKMEARHMTKKEHDAIKQGVSDLYQKGVDTIIEEDNIEEVEDEGFIVPVRNVWVVDHLRRELADKDEVLKKKDKELKKKDKELKKKDKVIEKKDKELRKKDKELKKKDKIINAVPEKVGPLYIKIGEIKMDPSLSEEEKDRKIKEIRAQINKILKDFSG